MIETSLTREQYLGLVLERQMKEAAIHAAFCLSGQKADPKDVHALPLIELERLYARCRRYAAKRRQAQ